MKTAWRDYYDENNDKLTFSIPTQNVKLSKS